MFSPFKKLNKEKEIDEMIENMISSITKNELLILNEQDQFKIISRLLLRFKEIKRVKVDEFASEVETINKLLNKLNEK